MSFEKVPIFLEDFFVTEMYSEEHEVYRFNSFVLDAEERELLRDSDTIPLTPKAFDTLSYLVRNPGHLVTKDELMNAIWPDSFVDEGNIPRTIHTLRKTLGEDNNGNKFIETVPTKGYRFVADVEKVIARSAGFHKEASINNARADIDSIGSDPVPLYGPTPEKGKRHYLFIPAAALTLIVLVTGFWISNGSLLPRPLTAAVNGHSTNGEAYRELQQGKFLVQQRIEAGYPEALEHFEKAIQIDPGYADAYAGKADVKTLMNFRANINDDIASARAAVKRSLELDENGAYAHSIQCRILGTYEWEFDQAVTECQRAVTLDPNDGYAHAELGLALYVVGRADEASAEMNTAVALSPTSFIKRSRAAGLYMSRRYDEAIEQLEQVEATDPDYTDAVRWLMSSFAMKNDDGKAFEYLIKFHEKNNAGLDDISAAKAAFASEGWPAAVRTVLNSSSGLGIKKGLLNAGLFAQIGEKDKAFEILNIMIKRRASMMINVAREPLLDPLRDDPRYHAILDRLSLK